MVLERMSESWKATYLQPVLKCFDHDGEGVRWAAMEAIKKNADRSFDEELITLLNNSDLRKRGLVAYLAVHLWKPTSFDFVRSMLKEESQLVRYDAVSALILEGGEEGRKIAFEHAADEPNPTLKKLIESAKQKKDKP